MLATFYKQFRVRGLTAAQAYTAAYAAVRVQTFSASEVVSWTHLLRGMTAERCALVRAAICVVQPRR